MANIKKFIKSSGVYFLGNVLCRLVSFFLLPLYTGIISPSDMGKYDVSLAYMSFLMSLLFLDISSAVLRFMMDYDGLEKYKSVNASFTIFCISSVLYVGGMAVLGIVLKLEFLWLLIAMGLTQTLNLMYGNIARGLGHNVYYATIGLITTVISLLMNVLLLTVAKMGYVSFYISAIVSNIIGVILLEINTKSLINVFKVKFDKVLFRKILKFCLPLCINSAAYWFLSSFNKVAISEMLSVEQNGYYAVAFKFTTIITLFASCIQLAWQELAYSTGAKGEKLNKFYTVATDVQIKMLLTACVFAVPAVGLVFKFVINQQYWQSAPIVPYYLVATAFTILSSFLSSSLSSLKKTKGLFLGTLSGAIVNVLVLIFTIKPLGVVAGAIALACGYTVDVIIKWFLLKKAVRVNFVTVKELAVGAVGIVGVILIYTFLNTYWNFVGIAVAVVATLFILRKEIIAFLKMLKNKKGVKYE